MYELRRERDTRERNASPTTFDTWWPKMHEDYERYVRPNREYAALLVQRRTGKTSLVLRDQLRAMQRGTHAGVVRPAHPDTSRALMAGLTPDLIEPLRRLTGSCASA